MRVQIWSLYRGCLAFGLLSCHDAIAASAKSVAASIDLKAEIGRSLTIGQPQAAPPFAFERMTLSFSGLNGTEDIEKILFNATAKPDKGESAYDFFFKTSLTDRQTGRTEGNRAGCNWTSAAKQQADCGFEEDGGSFKLILHQGTAGARAPASLVFGGSADQLQIAVANFENKKGEIDGVTLRAKGGGTVTLTVVWR